MTAILRGTLCGLLGLAGLCLAADRAAAGTWTLAGLSFSDHLGGARLLAARGRGTAADPIVLVEEITGAGPAVLVVENFRNGGELISPARGFCHSRWSSRSPTAGHGAGPASTWSFGTTPDDRASTATGCRSTSRRPSAPRQGGPLRADRAGGRAFDRIRFDAGHVDPAVPAPRLDILDANGRPVFYLVQRPIVLLAWQDLLPLPVQTAALDQDLPR